MKKTALFLSVLAACAFAADSTAEQTYNKACKKCHGEYGEKSAMNKSVKIADLSKEQIVTALTEYREGKRNEHGMGQVMKSQAYNQSDAQINALADYIVSLKNKKQ